MTFTISWKWSAGHSVVAALAFMLGKGPFTSKCYLTRNAIYTEQNVIYTE